MFSRGDSTRCDPAPYFPPPCQLASLSSYLVVTNLHYYYVTVLGVGAKFYVYIQFRADKHAT